MGGKSRFCAVSPTGKDMAEIAHMFKVSYKTVANNCYLLKAKLGARSRADLIRIAVESRASGKLA